MYILPGPRAEPGTASPLHLTRCHLCKVLSRERFYCSWFAAIRVRNKIVELALLDGIDFHIAGRNVGSTIFSYY